MADVPAPREQYLVSPNTEVEKKWIEAAIVEKECRVKRLEADMDEIVRGKVKKLKATIIMIKREIVELHNRLNKLEPIDVQAVE